MTVDLGPDRLAWAAVALAADVDACEALTVGLPVPRDRLDREVLTRIGEAAVGPPLTMTDELALRIEIARTQTSTAAAGPTEFVVVTADAFARVDEPHATALVVTGPDQRAVVSPGGTVIVFGAEGSGKTTLLVDLSVHFGAGESWLGLLEPTRPLAVMLVELEGVRAEFRRKLRDRLDARNGPPLDDRLLVLEQPWGEVSLRDDHHRAELARVVNERRVDLLIAGPLAELGVAGPGTPADVTDFGDLLAQLRALCERPLAIAAAHHENRAGQMSGAWGRLPDTILHLQPQGHGSLRVYWHKVRNASSLHQTTTRLTWADGMTFALADEEPARPNRVWDEIADYVLEHGGCAWNSVEKHVTGEGGYLRRRRDQMLEEGVIVNAGQGQKFELWHRDDPARPEPLEPTVSEGRHGSDTAASDAGDEGVRPNRVAVSPRKGGHGWDDASPDDDGEAVR